MNLFGKVIWFLLNAAIRGIGAMFIAVVVYMILGLLWNILIFLSIMIVGYRLAATWEDPVLDWGYQIILMMIFIDLMLDYLGLQSFTSTIKKHLFETKSVEGQDV